MYLSALRESSFKNAFVIFFSYLISHNCLGSWEAYSKIELSESLLSSGNTLRINTHREGEGSRIGHWKELSYDVVTTKGAANHMGNFEAGMALQNCVNWDRAFSLCTLSLISNWLAGLPLQKNLSQWTESSSWRSLRDEGCQLACSQSWRLKFLSPGKDTWDKYLIQQLTIEPLVVIWKKKKPSSIESIQPRAN